MNEIFPCLDSYGQSWTFCSEIESKIKKSSMKGDEEDEMIAILF